MVVGSAIRLFDTTLKLSYSVKAILVVQLYDYLIRLSNRSLGQSGFSSVQLYDYLIRLSNLYDELRPSEWVQLYDYLIRLSNTKEEADDLMAFSYTII